MTEEEEFEFRARLEAETQAKPPSQKPKSWADSMDPTMRKILQIGIPTAGAVAAELAMAPYTAGLSAIPAAMTLAGAIGVGGLGGEAINQATGISPVDYDAQKMALMGGPLGRSIAGVGENVVRLVPGVASALKASLAPEMRSIEHLKKLLPGPSSEHIYSQLAKGATTTQKLTQFPELTKQIQKLSTEKDNIPWEQLKTQMGEQGPSKLYDQIADSLKGTPSSTKMAQPTVGGKALPSSGLPAQPHTIPGQPAGLTFDEIRSSIEGLNKVINGTSDRILRGDYLQLKKAMLQDLEKMPPMPGVPIAQWKQAQQSYKIERARVALLEGTEGAITTKEGVDLFNPDKMVSWLRKGGREEIESRVGPQEYRKILNEYRSLASTVGHDWPKFFAMLIGGTAGSALGGAGGAVSGVSAGYVASDALSKAMMSERGRKLVRWIASDPRTSSLRRIGTAAGAAMGSATTSRDEEDE